MNKIKTSYGTIVSFILIISTILMPFSFFPKKADAQYGISGYTSGLAPAIARLPQCQKAMGSGIKKLFSGIGNLFSNEIGGDIYDPNMDDYLGENETNSDNTTATTENLDTKATSAAIKATSSPSSAETNKILKEIKTEEEKLNKTTKEINDQSSCIASIGRLISKMLLQKLTLSTVNWINSGFDGKPSFLQDRGKFFGDIAKNEILQFGIEIQGINPYSKDWLRNQALAYKTKFADNARYSLEEMIAQTNPDCRDKNGIQVRCDIAFSQDFSQGGWNAWTALTQVPANNPLGTKLMFDNEIQKRLAGTTQSTAEDIRDALKEANGFLGDLRCVDNYDNDTHISQQQKRETLEAGGKDPCTEAGNSWKYVTPGSMIAKAATDVMGYQNNSLLNVEDLNDAVAAVLDAILNQFSTNIYEKGFANLDYQGIDGVLVFSGTGNDIYKTQTEKDFMPSHLSSSWLQENPDFDIRTDLTQALIDEQRTYSDKLALQNKELMSTTDGDKYSIGKICPFGWTGDYPNCTGPKTGIGHGNPLFSFCPLGWTGNYPNCTGPPVNGLSNAYGLMPTIYQLDYCIPGPHPGWKEDSMETLASKLNSVSPAPETPPNTTGNLVNGAIGVGLNFVPFGVGPALSAAWGMLSSTFGGDAERSSTNTRQHFTNVLYKLTGYSPQSLYGLGTNQEEINMSSNEGLFYVMSSILDRYSQIMNKTYFSDPKMFPDITKEAAQEYEKLAGYNQIIKDNEDKILQIKTTVSILGEIKKEVNILNAKLKAGKDENELPFTETNYKEALKKQINEFGRLSANMVNGDDIAAVDDLAKQIIQKKDFIYKNLLKGPYGCEAYLEKFDKLSETEKNFPSATPKDFVQEPLNNWDKYNILSVKRMTYPFPILYDYNVLTNGASIPDPYTHCNVAIPPDSCKNKMPLEGNTLGPGFLSFVHFSAIHNIEGSQTYKYAGSERLSLNNLVNEVNPGDQSGQTILTNVSVSDQFEETIGIY